jgi:hypothetical protein
MSDTEMSFSEKTKLLREMASKTTSDLCKSVNQIEDSFCLRVDVPFAMGKDFIPLFRYKDERISVRSPLIENMFDSHIFHNICPLVLKDLDTLWDKQVYDKYSYGDMDFTFEKILDNKKVRVAVISDHVTCSDDNLFIVVQDKKRHQVHIRIIKTPEESDYKKSQFCQKPSLEFYRVREYSVNFVEDFHMTDLGGIYGDTRDPGYVLTFSYGMMKAPYDTTDLLPYYKTMNHVVDLLMYMSQEYSEKIDS